MERNSRRQLISVSEIEREAPYGIRFCYEDSGLELSLKKRGMLFPIVVVRKAEKWVVVSGHKRFFHALRCQGSEIPAVIIEEKFTPQELFLLALCSNWNQRFPELDRMVAFRKAEKEFRFSLVELQEEISPLLGLPLGRGRLEEYREVSGLQSEIHRLIHEGRIPFRGAGSLSRFQAEEQIFLAEFVFKQIHLTSSQLILLSEWLADLKRMKKATLQDLAGEKSLAEILQHSTLDFRSKGEKFFEGVRRLRFPNLSEVQRNFEGLKSAFEKPDEIHFDRPEGFEAEGILLRARLKDKEGVARILNFLKSHQQELETFF